MIINNMERFIDMRTPIGRISSPYGVTEKFRTMDIYLGPDMRRKSVSDFHDEPELVDKSCGFVDEHLVTIEGNRERNEKYLFTCNAITENVWFIWATLLPTWRGKTCGKYKRKKGNTS